MFQLIEKLKINHGTVFRNAILSFKKEYKKPGLHMIQVEPRSEPRVSYKY